MMIRKFLSVLTGLALIQASLGPEVNQACAQVLSPAAALAPATGGMGAVRVGAIRVEGFAGLSPLSGAQGLSLPSSALTGALPSVASPAARPEALQTPAGISIRDHGTVQRSQLSLSPRASLAAAEGQAARAQASQTPTSAVGELPKAIGPDFKAQEGTAPAGRRDQTPVIDAAQRAAASLGEEGSPAGDGARVLFDGDTARPDARTLESSIPLGALGGGELTRTLRLRPAGEEPGSGVAGLMSGDPVQGRLGRPHTRENGLRSFIKRFQMELPRAVREFVQGDPEVRPFVRQYHKSMTAASVLLVLVGLGRLLTSRLNGALVDAAVGRSVPGILLFAGGVILGSVAVAVCDTIYARMTQETGQHLAFDIRTHLLGYLLSSRSPGAKDAPSDMGSRLVNDVERIQDKNVFSRVNLPFYLITTGTSLFLMYATSPLLTAMVAVLSMALFVISSVFGRRMEAVQGRIASRRAAAIAGGTRIIASGQEGRSLSSPERRYRSLVAELRDATIESIRVVTGYSFVFGQSSMMAMNYLVLLVGFLISAWFGNPTVGMITAFVGYAGQLKGAIEGLLSCYTNNRSAEGQTRGILDLLGKSQKTEASLRPKAAMKPIS
jgi:hypothetical protein